MIILGFIDGSSRFVPGIDVQDNNRSATALAFLREVCAKHGVPSRMRGDHGMENIAMADFMERVRGLNRGSFIWGRYAICCFPT